MAEAENLPLCQIKPGKQVSPSDLKVAGQVSTGFAIAANIDRLIE